MKKDRKGFTLAELLIVVAIIAVLVAIAIPVFTTQLEKSREATDAANIRSAYAEAMADALSQSTPDTITKTVALKQAVSGWQNKFDFPANLTSGSTEPAADGSCVITVNPTVDPMTCTASIKLTQ
ncbi:MAG: prepilin-type N-terminal cleavage/methylation domain-containing protein [Eubacteriales bacterium]|nr:prepilin-type N-terminal cleavage/methylation domain-containing protein [Eubacteriales bacterium]